MSKQWIHTMDAHGVTPLDRAFKSGHMALADMMLRQDREDQRESLQGSSPLHRAAALGLTEAVKSLLGYGSKVMALDYQGETPLHKAARQGHMEAVELLVNASDVNQISADGMTPLHWACVNGAAEIVRVLLANNADPWIRNETLDGLSAVDIAEAMGYSELMQIFGVRAAAV